LVFDKNRCKREKRKKAALSIRVKYNGFRLTTVS